MKSLILFAVLFPMVSQASFWCDLGNPPSITIPKNPGGLMYRNIQVDKLGEDRIQIDFTDNYNEVHEVLILNWVKGSSDATVSGIQLGNYQDDTGNLRAVFKLNQRGFVQFHKDAETAANVCDTL